MTDKLKDGASSFDGIPLSELAKVHQKREGCSTEEALDRALSSIIGDLDRRVCDLVEESNQ